jgi:hypothetical protein
MDNDMLLLAKAWKQAHDELVEAEGDYPTENKSYHIAVAQACATIAIAEELRRLRELLLKQTRGGR